MAKKYAWEMSIKWDSVDVTGKKQLVSRWKAPHVCRSPTAEGTEVPQKGAWSSLHLRSNRHGNNQTEAALNQKAFKADSIIHTIS